MTSKPESAPETATADTAPPHTETLPVPAVGAKAPSSAKLTLPNPNAKPTIITFLRHCGCPFAEKSFRHFRYLANHHPEANFVAVSHCTQAATDEWIVHVGGAWDVEVIVDTERELYAQWGVGRSNTWHLLNPWTVYKGVRIVAQEGQLVSGSSGDRWQMAGSFAVDGEGTVRWVRLAKTADDMAEFKDGLVAVNIKVKRSEAHD
ncbi:hypothetical protein V495_07205 [Pseudogymnoascus sp. VKM F-4514 (FW-929)]|nr:hypothetical protein V495_07205 [Pseudogymnoascus sp. VKM F-4514 (FW-929)]KFY61946.1 hypothetical protein V497_02684 [Pseudogymnoascus sp. VKM F-4516 (FW-969)]